MFRSENFFYSFKIYTSPSRKTSNAHIHANMFMLHEIVVDVNTKSRCFIFDFMFMFANVYKILINVSL